MTGEPSVTEGAESYAVDGGPIGVLVSHGFTGTPASVRPWAQSLATAGFSVRLPRLPGHGTTWQDLNTRAWPEWYASVSDAYDELAQRCDQVFLAGLSMGGCLVTKLAIDHPEVGGVVLVNPAFGTMRRDAHLARYLARWIPLRKGKGIGSDIKSSLATANPISDGYGGTPVPAFVQLQKLWRVVGPELPRLTAPVRLYTSRVDHVVDPLSARLLRAGAVNTEIEQIWLEDSYHVATLDTDAPTIFAGTVDFITAHAGAPGNDNRSGRDNRPFHDNQPVND